MAGIWSGAFPWALLVLLAPALWRGMGAISTRRFLARPAASALEATACCEPKAAANTASGGTPSSMRVRVTVRARDRWGRAIASVVRLRGNVDVGRAMVTQGWAWTDAYGWRPGQYARAEALARAAGRGLFAERDPQTPDEFRRRHGSCQVGIR